MGIHFESLRFGDHEIETGELRFDKRIAGCMFEVKLNGVGEKAGGSFSMSRRGRTREGSLFIEGRLANGETAEHIVFGYSVKITGT